MEALEAFPPDVVLVHKLENADLIRTVTERRPCARMVHDHDIVCLRRHKYFPIGTKICTHPAGWHCYAHLCFIERRRGGGFPFGIRTVGKQRAIIRAQQGFRAFLVGSRWMRDELVMNGIKADRIHILPPVPSSLAQARPLPPSDRPIIVFVGQVIRGKGVDLLLRALARIRDLEWQARIIGDGNHLDACKHLADRLEIADRVFFLGQVPHEELEGHYRDACFTVVPSRWPEPFGMVGIEAMARGRAVVGFAAGGICDWLKHKFNGLAVPPADIEGLAAAMRRLLANREYAARLGRAAAEHVQRRYSHQDFIRRLQSILKEIA